MIYYVGCMGKRDTNKELFSIIRMPYGNYNFIGLIGPIK